MFIQGLVYELHSSFIFKNWKQWKCSSMSINRAKTNDDLFIKEITIQHQNELFTIGDSQSNGAEKRKARQWIVYTVWFHDYKKSRKYKFIYSHSHQIYWWDFSAFFCAPIASYTWISEHLLHHVNIWTPFLYSVLLE